MKKVRILLLFPIFCMLASACNDESDIHELFPAEFHKILYIIESGENRMTIYNTGENVTKTFTVCKAGSNPALTANVHIGVLSQDIVDEEYAIGGGFSYRIIPQETYKIDATELSFSSSEENKKVNITLFPDQLQQVMDRAEVNTQWVLPLEAVSMTDSINSEKNRYILYVDDVVVPPVGFKRAGVQVLTHDFTTGAFVTTASFGLLTVDNMWDIDATFAVDKEYVSAYNIEHGTAYQFPSEGTYAIDEQVSLAANEQDASVNISISDFQGKKSGYFMLPVHATGVSIFEIQESNELYALALRLVGKKFDRTDWEVIDFCTEEPTGEGTNGGHAAHVLDGNLSTYWHTMWSNWPQCACPHHLVIDTKLEREFTQVGMVQRKNDSWLGDIKNFTVSVSSDNQIWTEIGSGLGDRNTGEEQIFDVTPTKGRYLRFDFLDTWRSGESHISVVELYAYGVE